MRKRVFFSEAFQGPHEVRGQEMRRIVGNHASHQTCCAPSSGCINHSGGPPEAARSLGGCAICGRSFWREDLYDLHLFTRPASGVTGASSAHEEGVHREKVAATSFAVRPRCAKRVHELLDVRRYHHRWPKIPTHELFASKHRASARP